MTWTPQWSADNPRASDIAGLGVALWGPNWQAPMAAFLGVNLRTVQRWVSGYNAPQEWVWPALAKLIPQRLREARERVLALETYAEKLDEI
jgi:hypothetical protein